MIETTEISNILNLDKDFDSIFAEILKDFIARTKGKFTANVETDPAIILLQLVAFYIKTNNIKLEASIQESVLSLATGNRLDNLGTSLSLDRKLNENDDTFRERLLVANSISDHGTHGYYRTILLDNIPEIKSLHIIAPPTTPPGIIYIYSSGLRSATFGKTSKLIKEFFDKNQTSKMMTDYIQSFNPEQKTFDIKIQIKLLQRIKQQSNNSIYSEETKEKIKTFIKIEINKFLDNEFIIGNDITTYQLSCLITSLTLQQHLYASGRQIYEIYEIILENPANNITISNTEIARCNNIDVDILII